MPASPSPTQSDASRANGARSTGPVTEAGKAASARNATRHGLSATLLRLEPEEQALLADLRADLAGLHEPEGAAEEAVLHELALLEVRRRRLDALELGVLDALAGAAEDTEARLPSLATVLRYRQRLSADERDAWARLDGLRRDRSVQAAQARMREARTNEPEPRARAASPVTVACPPHSPAAPAGPHAPPAPAAPDRPGAPATALPLETLGAALNRAERRRLEALARRRAA